MKRCKKINASIETEIRDKLQRLGIPSDKSVRTVLVYDGALAPEVEENGFVDYLVPFSELMEKSLPSS